jgi:hypothetical protein
VTIATLRALAAILAAARRGVKSMSAISIAGRLKRTTVAAAVFVGAVAGLGASTGPAEAQITYSCPDGYFYSDFYCYPYSWNSGGGDLDWYGGLGGGFDRGFHGGGSHGGGFHDGGGHGSSGGHGGGRR